MTENIAALVQHFGKTYKKGEHVFYENDPGTEIYLVHKGEVRIYKTIRHRERSLFVMKKDDFFGEVAALTGTVRTASAVVLEETVLIQIPMAVLEKITVNTPEVAIRLLKRMAWRLKSADDLVAILMQGDPQVRAVLGIIRLCEIDGKDAPEGICFNMDIDDFAAQIEVEPNEILQVLDHLSRKGIIEQSKDGQVLVRNPDDLGEFYRFLELARKFGQKKNDME